MEGQLGGRGEVEREGAGAEGEVGEKKVPALQAPSRAHRDVCHFTHRESCELSAERKGQWRFGRSQLRASFSCGRWKVGVVVGGGGGGFFFHFPQRKGLAHKMPAQTQVGAKIGWCN